ncbi:MAG: hypothetical protein AUI52_04485 [Acidobacteria bacterium 13_1_40CM_2_68_10]|nr:MAG: hypothetical protein AUI52_04485 [Acidobacteria bacterium 13_1_40CM_2_68_10]
MSPRRAFLSCIILLAALASAAVADPRPPGTPRPLEIRLAGGTIRPSEGQPLKSDDLAPGWYRVAAVAPLEASARGFKYLAAVARGPLSPEERLRLEAAGAQVLDYLPVHAYRLRVQLGAEANVRSLPFVAWLGDLPRHLKIEPQLARLASGQNEDADVRLILAAGELPGRALETLGSLTVQAAPSGKDGAWRVSARVPASRLRQVLARLVALPEIEAIEPARRLRLFNQDAVWVHQSFVGPSPQETPIFDRGLFGCGQVVGIADTGQDYDLCFFRDTVNGPPPFAACAQAPCPAAAPAPGRRKDILYYNWSGTPTGDDDTCPSLLLSGSGHGTHTSGSIAGDALSYADCATYTTPGRNGGDGLAPGAKLVVQEMGDGLEYLNARGGSLWNLADVAYRSGARIHSDSWGGACYDALGNCIPGCTMPYDSFARDADLAMWTYPDLLLVLAAGNAGEFCPPPLAVGTPANAKSPLAVGSVGHGAAAGTPSSFSSPGPVFDGRLKPTLAAQGESTVSAASDADPTSNNCDTCTLDGTSMAAPTTAGLAALVREYYTAGFNTSGTRDPSHSLVPSAALVKATLIDGAVALGNAAPSPDFVSGYGRALLAGSLAFTSSPFKLRVDDQRQGLTTGGVTTHAYDVAAGTPFRATLVWTDYPAALNAATARVNELKLEVIDPSGNVWFQTLDPATGSPRQSANPTDPHDSVNVEERLVFDAPAPGRWVVRVVGVDVPWAPQPFALVVRGALTDCPAPASPGPPSLSTPAEHQVLISWNSVAGAVAYNVYRSLGSCPGGPWIPVATGAAGPPVTNSGLSGGTPYSYYVASTSDAAARCESAPSPCASVVPTGDCTLASRFGGITAAISPGTGDCAVVLSWNPAVPYCGSDVRYNVYRATDPDFTPGPANRIARCVIGTTWTDSADLSSGATYYYAVRSEDATIAHGGSCRGGNEDANLVRLAAVPVGPRSPGTLRDDAGDTGAARFETEAPWTDAPTGGRLGPRVYTAASSEGVCADLTSPILTLLDPGAGPLLTFATRHTLEYDPFGFFGAEGSLGQAEIATGPSFSNWTRLPLTPTYPASVDFPLNDCPTTADSTTYFSGTSANYTTYSASLANWGGSDVRVRFHLSGDYLYPSGSWWIDDVEVSGVMIPGACTTTSTGPPPIPDGGPVPGVPLQVFRSGAQTTVTWDATQCPAVRVNLYWGNLGDGTRFTGAACDLPPTGAVTLSLPDNVWLLAAATDGLTTDGSYSRDLSGAELSYTGAGLVCPAITKHLTNNGCP